MGPPVFFLSPWEPPGPGHPGPESSLRAGWIHRPAAPPENTGWTAGRPPAAPPRAGPGFPWPGAAPFHCCGQLFQQLLRALQRRRPAQPGRRSAGELCLLPGLPHRLFQFLKVLLCPGRKRPRLPSPDGLTSIVHEPRLPSVLSQVPKCFLCPAAAPNRTAAGTSEPGQNKTPRCGIAPPSAACV